MLDEGYARRLRGTQCFLLDMDGTFYLGDRLIEGSLAFLDTLAQTGRQALFLTNNSSHSAEYYRQKLRRMGVPEAFCRVYTSGQAAAHYVLRMMKGQRAYLLGNEMLREELLAMGVIIDEENPDYVLVGFDTTLDYAKMTRVCDLIRAGLPYIATHPDFNCPTETGVIPDIGAIMAFIRASTGREAGVVIGKPHKDILYGALEITGTTVGETAMVGDRLYTDIAAGINAGMTSILVLTGEATMQDVAQSPFTPDMVFERLSEMIPYLRDDRDK